MKRSTWLIITSLLVVSCGGPAITDDGTVPESPDTSTTAAASTTITTTATTTTTTTTVPPTPVLVTISGQATPWAVATLAFDPTGLPVIVYANETWRGELVDLSIVVATCGDPHCAVGLEHSPVWELPGTDDFFAMWGNQSAAIDSEGSVVSAFDVFVFEHDDPPETEFDALTQYVLTCGDPSCTEHSLESIGPVKDAAHPEGGFQMAIQSLTVSPVGQAYLVYEVPSLSPDAWLDFRLSACPTDGRCQPDATLDPLLYSLPSSGGIGTGISGDAALDQNGTPLFAMGTDIEGQPWRIILARCDDSACAQPTVHWLDVPTAGKSIRDVDLEVAGDGHPVLAYSDHVGDQLNLHLVTCHDPDCSSFSTIAVANRVRRDWDLTTNAAGVPYLVWGDVATDEAIIATCADSECTGLVSVESGLRGTQDWVPCLAIAPDGYPMVTFHQPDEGLQLFNCPPERCDAFVGSAMQPSG